MTLGALTLVALAALMHATWNALAKRALDPVLFLWASVVFACSLGLPVMIYATVRHGPPPLAGYPYIAATMILHAAYFYALGRAYRAADFTLVYPLVRGLGVALVPVLATWALDERVSPVGAMGIGLVVLGILSLRLAARPAGRRRSHPTDGLRPLALPPKPPPGDDSAGSAGGQSRAGAFPRQSLAAPHGPAVVKTKREPTTRPPDNLELDRRRASTARRRAGLGWGLLTGVTIAAYSVVDKAGVAHVDPVVYVWLMGGGISLLLLPVVARDRAALRLEWTRNARFILLASTLNLTGYLLVLFAFRTAPAGYVVAARELAIVFGAVIGAVVFKEPSIRLVAVGVIFAGVALIGLAR